MSDLPLDPPPPAFNCPSCGQAMSPSPDRANLLVCAACGCESFFGESEPETEEPTSVDPEPDLSAARIRRLATERRSINRTASYFIVATGVCLVAMAQLIWMTSQHVRSLGWTPRPVGYVLGIVVAVWGAWHFGGRAASLHRQARISSLSPSDEAPDFSTLDDGSKHWKNLEDVR